MRTTADDRLLRALKLLEAAHNPKAGPLLASRGFNDAALEEGWSLLDRALGRNTPACRAPALPIVGEKDLLLAIDRWENTWFDVADAALTRQAPALRERLFDELRKRQGRAVLASVARFLDRLDTFDTEAQHDPATAAAMTNLATRGLDNTRRQHARTLLAQLQQPDIDSSPARADREAARAELWAWYKDWAKTARTIITDRRLCIAIGLSRPRDAREVREPREPLERKPSATLSLPS